MSNKQNDNINEMILDGHVRDTIVKYRKDMKMLETATKSDRTKYWVNKINEMFGSI